MQKSTNVGEKIYVYLFSFHKTPRIPLGQGQDRPFKMRTFPLNVRFFGYTSWGRGSVGEGERGRLSHTSIIPLFIVYIIPPTQYTFCVGGLERLYFSTLFYQRLYTSLRAICIPDVYHL